MGFRVLPKLETLRTQPLRYSTFSRIYALRWKDVLKFRNKNLTRGSSKRNKRKKCISQRDGAFCIFSNLRFSRCEVCTHLTNQINDHSISIEEKLAAVKTFREHLHQQYIDRSIQWALNELSTEQEANTLTILIDGMDQAKFRIPRHPHHRAIASMLPFEHTVCFFDFVL